MGFGADAELIWGIPVLSHDEEGEPTAFWDEEADDWREFEGELEVRTYGHYEDEPRAILTSTRVKRYAADCWDPSPIPVCDLATELTNDKVYSKSTDQARASGLDVSFYASAGWHLVASYG